MPKAKYKKRKDGRYSTSVKIGVKPNGKPILKTLYGKTIAELERKKSEYTVNIKKMIKTHDNNITFKMYSDNWYTTKEINTEYNTSRMYGIILRNYTHTINDLLLHTITREDIQFIINTNKDKARTCQQIKLTLNQIFEQAIDDELITKNPCRKLILPKYRAKEKRALTETEDRLTDLSLFEGKEQIFVMLAKFYGLRKSEILGLTKDAFDFKEEKLTLKQALVFKNSTPIIKSLKTKHGYRSLFIFQEHIIILKQYFKTLPNEWLFRNTLNPSKITPQGYKKLFESIKKKINDNATKNNLTVSNDLSAHIFRHNFATTLYKADVSIKDAQYLLGHATPQITLNIYTHLDKEKTDVRNKIKNIMNKDGKK